MISLSPPFLFLHIVIFIFRNTVILLFVLLKIILRLNSDTNDALYQVGQTEMVSLLELESKMQNLTSEGVNYVGFFPIEVMLFLLAASTAHEAPFHQHTLKFYE